MSHSDSLIVLNNDTLVCEGCYELNAPSETTPDVDYGLWPMGRVAEGQCSNCGARVRRSCPGHRRHWFSVHGQAYLRSPVCVRCGAPNPRALSEDDWSALARFNQSYPAYVGQHVVDALREAGRD